MYTAALESAYRGRAVLASLGFADFQDATRTKGAHAVPASGQLSILSIAV